MNEMLKKGVEEFIKNGGKPKVLMVTRSAFHEICKDEECRETIIKSGVEEIYIGGDVDYVSDSEFAVSGDRPFLEDAWKPQKWCFLNPTEFKAFDVSVYAMFFFFGFDAIRIIRAIKEGTYFVEVTK